MVKNTTCDFNLTVEQLDALVVSIYPVMQEFFKSDEGKRIYEQYLNEKEDNKDSAA